MMRDEVLRATEDPCEVAPAQLVPAREGRGDAQASGVGQGLGPSSGPLELISHRQRRTHFLGSREVEAEEVAAFAGHRFILTAVDMTRGPGRAPSGTATEQARPDRFGHKHSRCRPPHATGQAELWEPGCCAHPRALETRAGLERTPVRLRPWSYIR